MLGLPEVKLGLLPGWGGTVRLTRLIGPGPAVELAASGEPLDGAAAVRAGVVDACVPAAEAVESARRLLVLRGDDGFIAARRRRLAAPVDLDPVEREFLEATTAAVILGRTGGHYPAPPAILRTILAGASVDAATASRLESEAFAKLATTPVARNLLRVFAIGERNRRDSGIDPSSKGEPVPAVAPAIVGAGIMGAGIAASHLRAGLPVTVIDVNPEALAASVPGILEEAAWDRRAKRPDEARAVELAGRLRTATSLAALAAAAGAAGLCAGGVAATQAAPSVYQRQPEGPGAGAAEAPTDTSTDAPTDAPAAAPASQPRTPSPHGPASDTDAASRATKPSSFLRTPPTDRPVDGATGDSPPAEGHPETAAGQAAKDPANAGREAASRSNRAAPSQPSVSPFSNVSDRATSTMAEPSSTSPAGAIGSPSSIAPATSTASAFVCHSPSADWAEAGPAAPRASAAIVSVGEIGPRMPEFLRNHSSVQALYEAVLRRG